MLHFAKWKISLIIAICLLAAYVSLPNFFAKNAESELLPDTRFNLGLDLQGGSYLLLEIDFQAYLREQIDNLRNDVRGAFRGKTINEKRIRYTGGITLTKEGIQLVLTDSSQVDGVIDLIEDISDDIEATADGNQIRAVYTELALDQMRKNVIEQSIEIVRRRVDETGTREPDIQRQGDDRILLQVPGLQDPEHLKRLLGKTAKLSFHLLDETAPFPDNGRSPVPPGSMRLKGYQYESAPNSNTGSYVIKRRVMLTGELLVDARATFSQGQPVVSFRFNNLGAKKFGDITRDNVGKPFAIVLDGQVISAPVIREPILGGSGQISGSFTTQEANDLALLLRAGALPAPLHILEERTVGPSLGADSIAAGQKAIIAGIIIVIVFMLLSFGLFGVFSNLALAMNMILIIAVLSLFGATLTLPGIAGIVLTMGMAVDANVLIFERIKEEARNGKTPFAAIDHGFRQAFKTILDSNITTLIAAILLYNFGSGPIKGFAVTLSVGIVTSMFSAILLTRLMVVTWLKKTKPQAIPL